MRTPAVLIILGIYSQATLADEINKLHATEVRGEVVYGHLTVKTLTVGAVDWFKPCDEDDIGYPREELDLIAQSRTDCPDPSFMNDGGDSENRDDRTGPFDTRSQTLADLQSRGMLNCGVSLGSPGFAEPDESGEWQGFDVSICRAVAAAVLGDATAVQFVPTTNQTRFTALASGEIDILARNTTWTFSRDVELNYEFAGINYYDGQGFMVRRDLGVTSATELDGAAICVQVGTTTELNLADFFRSNGLGYDPVLVESNSEAQEFYLAGLCDAYTTDASALAATRATFASPTDHLLLPEIVSQEPLGPLVRHGDQEWGDVVRWTLNALIAAEQLGITSANVQELAQGTANPEVNRILGSEGNLGESLGLSEDWATNVISSVGNYGEIFDDNLGENSPIGLARGLNAQWTDGGLLYSPPFR